MADEAYEGRQTFVNMGSLHGVEEARDGVAGEGAWFAAPPRFRVLAQLGQGGMANVHLAIARGPVGFSKLVVLKSLRSDLVDDPAMVEMFLHEARLAARLNHPNVVQTFEVGVEAGQHAIVMEYLEGQTLAQIRRRAQGCAGGIPLEMHLRMLNDVLGGLHHAHELSDYDGTALGLVHRDVSPQNVFVTFDGQVKLLDFGIATLTKGRRLETQTGVLKGKIDYMSPEQMMEAELDRRSDLFAVGIMLWEAAAGRPLWKGLSEVGVMNRVLNGDIPRLRDVNPWVSKGLERICLKAMARSREDRYATAAELQIDLEREIAAMGGGVKQRDVGRFVADLFAAARAERKTVIDLQVRRAARVSGGECDSFRPLLLPVLRKEPSSWSNSDLVPPMPRPTRLQKVSLAAWGAALSLGVACLLWWKTKGTRAMQLPT
ncbi:serine/threonine protein kinase [Pendulispora brunnea]|uniref:Serine/threonine protein kinase n=1 Tax=Pendulispora brunnea TaxID=2905690 RepID=A0ABZ2K405_9BACT